MTTQKALTALLARRRQAIGKIYAYEYGIFKGEVKLTAYDAETDVYTSPNGLRWEFKGNALAPVYGADFLAEEQRNREAAGL